MKLMHVGFHFIKTAPGSASPYMGRAPPSSFILSSSKVVLYCAKPTCRCLYSPNERIPFLLSLFLSFQWEKHFRIPLSVVSKLVGTTVCIDSLKWLYPEEHDMVVSAFQERSQLHGRWASAFSRNVHPKSFVQYRGPPRGLPFCLRWVELPPLLGSFFNGL